MKGKKKITIELDKKAVADIIRAYFVNTKNIVIQDLDFNIEHKYGEYPDEHGYHEFTSVTCTREDTIDV